MHACIGLATTDLKACLDAYKTCLFMIKNSLRVLTGQRACNHVLQVQLDGHVGKGVAGVGPQSVTHGLEIEVGADVGVDGEDDWQNWFVERKPMLTFGQIGGAKKTGK